jgi:hypothetical protein
MKTIMKNKAIKSTLIALGLIMFGAQSCKDFLKEELISGVSAASYYTTAAGLEDAVDATYTFLREIHSEERAYSITVFGTDTHTNGADGGWKSFNYYDNALNSGADILSQTWTFLYQGINQANAVLNRSEAVADINPATLLIRQAEVRFLRAYYYYYLTQQWGNVHLSLEETIGPQVTANKTAASEIYTQAIIPDLEFAIANLPVSQSQYGRATRTAAQFLLAKAYLTRGWTTYAQANDFATANTLFTDVLNTPGRALVANHAALWNQDNQVNSEIIWAVQYSNDLILNGGDTGVGNRGHLYFGMEYDIQPGMIRDIGNGRPFKRFVPTAYLRNLWQAGRADDQRYETLYKHAWICNDNRTSGNSIPKWKQIHVDKGAKKANGALVTAADIGTNRFALGDTALFIPGPGKEANWLADEKLKVRYTVITSTKASYPASTLPTADPNYYPSDPFFFNERLFPVINKFFDPRRPTIQWERGSRDWFLFRVADAYLLRAEARFKLNDQAGALADLNVVRTRAAKPGRVAQMQLVGPVTIEMILDERAREMDAEQCRWFDLVRTNTLVSRVTQYNPQAHVGGTLAGAANIQAHHVRRPIPQTQIDRTVGGYPQNCGYAGGDCSGG